MDHKRPVGDESNSSSEQQQQPQQPNQKLRQRQKQKQALEERADKQSNKQKAITSQRQQPASLLDVDPLQSIANVLNHHHRHRLDQEQRQTQVSTGERAASGQGGAAGPAADQVTGGAVAASSGSLHELGAARRTTGGVGAGGQDGGGAESTQNDRCEGEQVLPALKQTNSHSSGAPARQQRQVDQGNSYLYAYNDFITTPAGGTEPGAELASKQRRQEERRAAQSPVAPNLVAPNSKVARRAEAECECECESQATAALGEQKKGFFFLARRKQSATEREKERQRDKQAPPREVGERNGRQVNQSLKVAAASGDRKWPAQAVGAPASQTTSATPGELLTRLVSREEADEEVERVFVVSHASQQRAAFDEEQGEEGEEEEEDEDDTLSFILNRNNLSVASHANPLQLQQHLDTPQAASLLVCSHGRANYVNSLEQPNHLRRYLGLEENFNSYKAAKRRHQNQNQNHQHQQRRAAIGTIEQHQGAGSRAGTAASAASHLHLPLANYIIATNEQVEQGDQFVIQQQQEFPSYQPAGLDQQAAQSYTQSLALLNQQREEQRGKSYLQLFRFVKPKSRMPAGQAGAYYAPSAGSSEANLAVSEAALAGVQQCSQQQQQQQQQLLISQKQPMAYHVAAHGHHNHHHHHLHAHQQAAHYTNHYPITSSDSSLGSSGAFASSAMRATSGWLRDFCSKKCLFITCLLLILFVFVLVISLSAYLNFLIASSKTNLQPLSGRLRADLLAGDLFRNTSGPVSVEAMEALAQRLMHNKSSAEFLTRQRDFETIIRGAMDRTQAPLKSYPNHLVKLEVYALRSPGVAAGAGATPTMSLWVYFRLFLNKRTLQLDGALMRRKSPDEPFERQFLPRLTQQTLHSGFEQLLAEAGGQPAPALEPEAGGQLAGINARRFGQAGQPGDSAGQLTGGANRRLATRAARATAASATSIAPPAPQNGAQLKSFDEQITRLLYLVEAIDLQSILVTSDFDLAQTLGQSQLAPPAPQWTSETLRASQPIISDRNNSQPTTTTTTTTTQTTPQTSATTMASVTPASAPDARQVAPTSAADARRLSPTRQPAIRHTPADEPEPPGTPTTRFTLQPGYRENATRPGPLVTAPPASAATSSAAKPSLFLVNQSQRKQVAGQARPGQTQVVRLVSGQPLVSQSGQTLAGDKLLLLSSSSSTASASDAPASSTPNMQMVPTLRPTSSAAAANIEELWNNAINGGAARPTSPAPPTRLLTVSSVGAPPANESEPNGAAPPASSDWHKISVLSADVADTIRARLSAGSQARVSPPMSLGGALVTQQQPAGQQNNQARQAPTTTPTSTTAAASTSTTASGQVRKKGQESAVVLARDVGPPGSAANGTQAAGSPSPRPKQKKQKQQHSAPARNGTSAAQVSTPNDQPKMLIGARNATSAQQQQPLKPNAKPAKAKKVAASDNLQGESRPSQKQAAAAAVTTRPTSDKPQAANRAALPDTPANATTGRAKPTGAPREQPAGGNNLPNALTTIELTRSTTALPAPNALNSSGFVLFDQQARPGTTAFSGQWRPIAATANAATGSSNHDADADDFWASGRNRTRTPASVSLIVATQRLPDTLNRASGSQSPFAMPNGQLLAPARAPSAPAPEPFANRFRASQAPGRSAPAQNDFESRRVSRMRQSHSHRDTELADGFGAVSSSSIDSTSSSSSSALSASSSSSTTTTSSSLSLAEPANARLVDDFMITTDRSDAPNGRSSTLLPPLVLSGLHHEHPVGEQPPPPPPLVVQTPARRTRGPFAFETLHSLISLPMSAQSLSARTGTSPAAGLFDSLDFEPTVASARAERSPEVGARTNGRPGGDERHEQQHRMLVRKQLLLANELGDEQPDGEAETPAPREFGNRRLRPAAHAHQPGRCPAYGCKLRASGAFGCLSKAQICDDQLDCQDESDELDCVSLLKFDPKTRSMGFSNGAGIVYLNRRGSLAPMCIDSYHPNVARPGGAEPAAEEERTADARLQTNSAHQLDALQLTGALKRQNELIRQINTIGQYACSLQSFARLVSVKINHHDQVDAANLIKSSRLFHKLAISAAHGAADEAPGGRSNGSGEWFKSGQFGVEIASSADCPSQRTVFVKCGGFQCGQEAFSLGSRQPAASASGERQRQASTPTGVVINDLPWLVKLYWLGALTCHGYLIDESWLIAARECFQNTTTIPAPALSDETRSTGWTAEISYEHYGNADYNSIESNRRNVKEILIQAADSWPPAAATHGRPLPQPDGSAIVLAKLERPVRFSPLNRPICLPSNTASGGNSSRGFERLDGLSHLDCVTVTLPLNDVISEAARQLQQRAPAGDLNLESSSSPPPASSASSSYLANKPPTPVPTQQQQQSQQQEPRQTQLEDLSLNRVKLLEASDCLPSGDPLHSGDINGNTHLCAQEISLDLADPSSRRHDHYGGDQLQHSSDATRALICSQPASSNQIRPKWTVVGVQTKAQPIRGELRPNRRLFRRISSQIDWIVDTMNPKQPNNSNNNDSYPDRSNPQQHFDTTNSLTGQAGQSASSANGRADGGDELSPLLLSSGYNLNQQHQTTCNQFKCFSGECLSWSRICDGLYDCSSQDDEKDCHK